MQFLLKLLLLAPTALSAIIPNLSSPHADNALLKRDDALVVTGAPVETPDKSVPSRLEIRQLQANPDLWNLYLLGMSRFQNMDQQAKTSYYQLAGIHGRPWTMWDNVPNAPGMQNSGYCTHSNVLFASWHRPYLAAYEQVLYSLIQQIASEFPAGPTRDRYVAAAKNFRTPYWDFAAAPPAGQSVLPASLTVSTVSVNAPAGAQTIDNPLYSYKFHPLNQGDLPDQPFVYWQQTIRYPNNMFIMNAQSQNNLVAKQLDNSRTSFRSRIYNLFSAYSNFNSFSNKAWIQSAGQGNFDSLESVHDQIHGLVGNGGHMGVVDYSAFDPIFWLHHTMIDRTFALWQAIYPDSYVQPGVMSWGTFAIPQGSTVDVNTPLKPFHKDTAGNFYTSADVRSTRTFGYTYPELQGNQDPNALKAQVAAMINTLYGNTASKKIIHRSPAPLAVPESVTPGTPIGPIKRSVQQVETSLENSKRSVSPPDNATMPSTHQEFVANLLVPRTSLPEPVFVHLFLGEPASENPADWSFDPNLLGTHTFLVKNCTSVGGAACPQYAADAAITGALPITQTLVDCPTYASSNVTDEVGVLALLQEKLHFRVSTMTDEDIKISGLQVTVASATVTEPQDITELPQWSAWVEHPDIVCNGP